MDTQIEADMKKRIATGLILFLCLFGLLTGVWKTVVYAADETKSIQQFTGDVTLLKKDSSNYVMQVTVENMGEDFEGTVQVIFLVSSWNNCAYNTEITLPVQGKKQFTLTVPERAVDTMRGMCVVNFLDEKGQQVQSISLQNVFGNEVAGIPVGVLSDHYADLSYMDAGGSEYSIQGTDYPLKMIELNNENLATYLDGLYFLIIDRFNVASLDEENILAIQHWIEGGGWLLLGTGAYAEQTLSGFEEDFLGAELKSISEPVEENIASENIDRNDYYYYDYTNAEIDFTQMVIAELDYDSIYYYESSENPAICRSLGDGSVAVFFFSLGDEKLQDLDEYMIFGMYDEALYRSNSYRRYGGYSDMEYTGQRLLAYIDSSNTSVDFTWLEALIGIYVILVGPVLYLILRKCKKSEWYWIGVPVLGFTFIAGVFFFGQGSKVNETKVCSVTVQRADSNQKDTYFLAYHSGIKEWDVLLNDSYEAASLGWTGYGYYSGTNLSNDYHYLVNYDSDGISVGLKPQENFESGFFYASGRTESKGNLSGADIREFSLNGDTSGTITNETDQDLSYLAVWHDPCLMVFSELKAGETLDLKQAVRDGRCLYREEVPYFDNLLYDLVSIYGNRTNPGFEQDDMSALLIGLGIADELKPLDRSEAVVVGVVKNYDKAVAGRCNEISYGCLYSYVEMEGR